MARRAGLFAATLATLVSVPARACPMCKESVSMATTQPADAAAVDFNPSIGVMLAALTGVAAVAGRAMVKAARSAGQDA